MIRHRPQPTVLHLLAPASFGGLETVVRELTVAQREDGMDAQCALLLPQDAESPLEKDLRARGVPVHRVDVRPRAYRAERAAVGALLSRLRPAILHTHGYRPVVLHSGVARRGGIATVTTIHGFTGGDWKNRLFEWLLVRFAARGGATIAVSRQLVERLRRDAVPEARLHLIPNASRRGAVLDRIAARQRLGLPPSGLVVGSIGRLSFEKGPDVLLEAVPAISAAHVVLIGDGPMRATLAARAVALGIAARVHLVGELASAGDLVAAFDVFVLSSRTEGMPMVLLEAMHAQVPIVATEVGGVPELIDRTRGWLVPSEAPAELATALNEALGNPSEGRARARAGALHIAGLGTSTWVERHREAYASAMDSGASTAGASRA